MKLIIGIIEAIITGMMKLLFVFLAKITTNILPKKKLNPNATPVSYTHLTLPTKLAV